MADGVFDLPKQAKNLALGPDGNIWVTLDSADPDLARVSPDGTVTPFTTGKFTSPSGIAAGPDGNLWITMVNNVGKFSPADPTGATVTNNNQIGGAQQLVLGQDGNFWTGSGATIFKFTPTTPVVFTPIPTNIAGFDARETVQGTDGKIWVANTNGSNTGLLPVTLAGAVGTQVNTPTLGSIGGLAAGPGGQVAYTNPNATPQQMGLVNNGAAASPFLFPAPADPNGIMLGQDGVYWVAQSNPSAIGRYTTDGVYTKFADMPANSFPRRIARGANGTIWVILERPGELFSRIARITGVEPPANPDGIAPAYTKVKLTNSTFKVGPKKTALVAKSKKKKTPTGTTLSYTLSEIATTTIEVQKATAGRKSGKNCVKPTAKLKKAKAKKCTRYVVVNTLTRLQLAGANKVSFSGRIGKTKLKAGKYRFSITGKDAAGNVSAPVKKSFAIVTK